MTDFICPEREDCSRPREINFKKRDIYNMISEEIPCLAQGSDNPCDYSCLLNSGQAMEVMVCYKTKKSTKAECDDTKTAKEAEALVKPSKSRELRGGILYIGCDCEKRNGLQDDCQRTGCHGSPACLTKPKPICGPSEFSNGKHLQNKGHKSSGGRGGDGGKAEAGDKGGKNQFEGYQCFPAIIQKVCWQKC